MSSPKKFQDSDQTPEPSVEEEFARYQCIQSLFSDHLGSDNYLLDQVKKSIEESLASENKPPVSFESFCRAAADLVEEISGQPASYGFIYLDFSERTWDPLFASQEITQQLKRVAGLSVVFILVKSLKKGLRPKAKYETTALKASLNESKELIENLAAKWSTPSCKLQIIYIQ